VPRKCADRTHAILECRRRLPAHAAAMRHLLRAHRSAPSSHRAVDPELLPKTQQRVMRFDPMQVAVASHRAVQLAGDLVHMPDARPCGLTGFGQLAVRARDLDCGQVGSPARNAAIAEYRCVRVRWLRPTPASLGDMRPRPAARRRVEATHAAGSACWPGRRQNSHSKHLRLHLVLALHFRPHFSQPVRIRIRRRYRDRNVRLRQNLPEAPP